MTTELTSGEDLTSALRSTPERSRSARRSRGRRRWVLVVAVVLITAVGGGAWYVLRNRADGDTASKAPKAPPTTAAVTRQNLAQTKQVDGTLGYGTEYLIAGGRQGVLTWLPAEGSTVSRGKALYQVANDPVALFYGSLPFYRTLQDGVDDGPDVLELENNLKALGYTGFTVDEEFNSDDTDAIKAWQEDKGLPETGVVKVGDVVVLPAAIRISDQKVQQGQAIGPGNPVLGYTGTTRTVTVALDVADSQLAKTGRKVTIELPGSSDTTGTISNVGTVAKVPASSGSDSSASSTGTAQDATIEVTVTLDNPTAAGGLDQAPVDVDFVSDVHKNVLTVPVTALLALQGGGYGVQVVEGETTRIVAVKVGMFGAGRVEVSGGGLRSAMKVEVPKS
jgi:membrane fusion protein, multidrug efflux system